MILVRHASAGDRHDWEGHDHERPLDKRGRKQAKKLTDRFEGHRIDAILTSPAVRCVQTVEPLARARGLEVDVRRELAEELQATAGAELLRELAGRDVVVCCHGGLEVALPHRAELKKSEAIVLGERLEMRGSV